MAYVTDTITTNLQKLARRYAPGGPLIGRALYRRAEMVMTDSKNNFVPVEFSTLRNSGMVHFPEVKGTTVSVMLSYGGAAQAYALAIHEHPSKHSPPSWKGVTVRFHPAGRGPKYLERPLMNAQRTLLRDLAQDLKFERV